MSRALRDIRDGLLSQPGRLSLSMLAIVLGVAVLAVLLSLVGGIQQKAGSIVQEMGVDVLAVLPTSDDQPLREQELDRLRAAFPGGVVSGVRSYTVDTRDGETRLTVLASDAALLSVRPWPIIDGRSLDVRDVSERKYHCLISRQLSEQKQWRVGHALAVSDQYLTVVGIIDPGGSALEQAGAQSALMTGENLVVIPETIPPYWSRNRVPPNERYDVAYVKLPAETSSAVGVQTCERVLHQPTKRVQGFAFITPDSLIAHLRKLQQTIQWTAGSLALLCLVLGGTTLASLMIANVQERFREIGLRLALGASEWSIAALFVGEAILLTLIAGLVGTGVAHTLLFTYADRLPAPIQLNVFTLLAPVLFAVIAGALFAWWPASSAARIRPSDALRNE